MPRIDKSIDRLAEATGGKHHWNDHGMDDLESGWEEFTLGTRVEVRISDTVWKKGTVVEEYETGSERGITVECDEKWHDNLDFFNGKGAGIPVFMTTRRSILCKIRKIDEPPIE